MCRPYELALIQRKASRLIQKKCKIGLDRTDWVGHYVDADGVHFCGNQLSEVAEEFPTPIEVKTLNECVDHMNWPSSKISHMIERISPLKPKKFAKFGMAKSYW